MKAYLGRRYHFAASHRLHASVYTDEQNRAVFGKCNNPFGHGHNYVVEIMVSGPVDMVTGMVCNLADLDGFARTHLLDRLDHQNLNTLPAFAASVPTTENLAIEVYRIFANFPHAHLERVHLEETGNNSFTYDGEGSAEEGRGHAAH